MTKSKKNITLKNKNRNKVKLIKNGNKSVKNIKKQGCSEESHTDESKKFLFLRDMLREKKLDRKFLTSIL